MRIGWDTAPGALTLVADIDLNRIYGDYSSVSHYFRITEPAGPARAAAVRASVPCECTHEKSPSRPAVAAGPGPVERRRRRAGHLRPARARRAQGAARAAGGR